MTRIHYAHEYIVNPNHPVTVNLVGAGGTGCRVLGHLAAIDSSLQALGHPGLYVTVYDPDTVSEANRGRQLFNDSEVGLNKAVVMVSRMNNFYGTDWSARTCAFPASLKHSTQDDAANITITCTDNIKSRLDMAKFLTELGKAGTNQPYRQPIYWMDFGNSRTSGQAVLGTVCKEIRQPKGDGITPVGKLKTITEMFNYSAVEVRDSGPSCSQAEALEQQDLFVNPTVAVLGCDILWRLFRPGYITHHGVYVNLDRLTANPVTV